MGCLLNNFFQSINNQNIFSVFKYLGLTSYFVLIPFVSFLTSVAADEESILEYLVLQSKLDFSSAEADARNDNYDFS